MPPRNSDGIIRPAITYDEGDPDEQRVCRRSKHLWKTIERKMVFGERQWVPDIEREKICKRCGMHVRELHVPMTRQEKKEWMKWAMEDR